MKQVLFLALALTLTACDKWFAPDTMYGYVEGNYLRLAPHDAGFLRHLAVAEGDTVEKGALLYQLDTERAELRLQNAEANLKSANATVRDLSRGARKEEIVAADKRLDKAIADLAVAEATYRRTEKLFQNGDAAHQRLDETKSAYEGAQAAVDEAKAQSALLRLPSRTNVIKAAEEKAAAAKAEAEVAERDLDDRKVYASKAGVIEEIYYRPGEFVAAGAPVVSLLPPENKKIRFFVPETRLARIKLGDKIGLSCDDCPDGLTAIINFISSKEEFTPPVIYSSKERAKFVYMVEALPDSPDQLKVGQPVAIRLTP